MEPHSWLKFKRISYQYCGKCGLIALHNAISVWCAKHGCNHTELPEYKKKLRELTH